jgi:hypothetical protein
LNGVVNTITCGTGRGAKYLNAAFSDWAWVTRTIIQICAAGTGRHVPLGEQAVLRAN